MAILRQNRLLSSRGVQVTSGDDFIAEYSLGRDCNVIGLQISMKPTAGVPTAAQLQGYTRVIMYRGGARQPSQTISLAATDPKNEVEIFLDQNIGTVQASGTPIALHCGFPILKEESFSVEICRALDSGGAGFDCDVALVPLVQFTDNAPNNQGLKAV